MTGDTIRTFSGFKRASKGGGARTMTEEEEVEVVVEVQPQHVF